VWDARTGRLIQTFGGGDNPLQDAHFIGRDGAVVTASRDGVVRVLNAESGDETLVLRGSSGLTGVAASADGSRIYVENWGLIKVWDASGTERLDLQIGSRGTISPDGTQVATSGSEIVIVDVNGDHQRTTLSSDPWAASMLFSPNGELIAAFGLDVGVRIWNARTGAAVATLPPQRSGVSCFAFSPDGTLAVTGSGRGDIQLWEIASGRRIATLRGHFGRITDVAFNQQGTNIATASIDGTVRIWPVAGLRAIATLYPGDGVVDAALDAAGSRIFAVTNNGAPLGSTTHVWDARTLRLLTEDDSLESAFGLADSRAGFIAFDFRNTRREGAAVGFDILRRRPVVDLRPHESQITGVEYSQDGRFILTSTMGGIVRVWRAPTEHIATLPHDQFVGDAAFNGDGTQIVTASVDGAARIWRASDPERRSWSISATLRGHTLGLSQARFSADSRFIVSASGDHTARIWDASTGRLLRVLSGHEEAVTSASFSESGANVLTSSRDGTARLWDASSGRTIVVLGDLGSPVLQARFGSSDTNVILAAEGGVQVWDIASALLPTQNLTAAVCSWLLLPMNGSRTFLATEADADPLVRDVWGGQASERDVCEGVPGIPPVTRQSPQLRVRAQ
jgi:WD40 repeat protein